MVDVADVTDVTGTTDAKDVTDGRGRAPAGGVDAGGSRPSPVVSGRTWSVLLVEDDPGDVRLLQSLLRHSGQPFELRVAGTLAEAIEVATTDPPVDIAVVDLGLPDATGMQAVEDLREAAVDVPVVVLTGHDDPRTGLLALQHGAQDYLVKGTATAAEVERSLRFAIERHRLTHLVTSAVLQRETMTRIELAGRRMLDIHGFVDAAVDAVVEALPRVRLAMVVRTPDTEVQDSPTVQQQQDWDTTSWQLEGTTTRGELTVLSPVDRPLKDHERSFLARVAELSTGALDAFSASTGRRLRERQLRVLYEVSRTLVECSQVRQVVDRVPPLVLDAVRTTGDVEVTMVLDGASVSVGAAAGPARARIEEPVVVDGTRVGSVAATYRRRVASASDQDTILAHVAALVAAWAGRHRAEQDRDEGRRRMELLLAQLPAVVWSTDAELRLTSITGSGTAALTTSPAIGDSLVDYFAGDAHPAALDHRRALDGETVADSFWWQDAWWEVMVGPMHDEDGAVVGVFGVGLDATSKHQAQQAADQARRRYTALFEQSRDAIVLTDEEGRLTDVNHAMCRLVGRSRDQLLGTRTPELAPSPQEMERFRSLRQQMLEDGSQRGTLPLAGPDGTTVVVEYHSTTGILPGTHLAILRDVTEQVRMQRALQASEQRFRTLAQNALDGIFLISLVPERTYEYVNPALERITGFAADDIRADTMLLRRRTHPHDVADVIDVGDVGDEPRTVRFHRADGEWRWMELRQTQITDDHGRVVALQGIVVDVTDHKRHADAVETALVREQQATVELRRLNTLKDTFLQAASHELRTPLTAIYGVAATLRNHRHELEDEEAETLLERLMSNAERLRQLLDDLLDLDRITQTTLVPQLEHVDLAETARAVADDFHMGHHILQLDLTPTPATVEPSKVERILHNLLANIVKHTPSGTTAHVTTHPDRDGVAAVLVVEDDGPGIDPAIREELFEPFVQGPASSTMAQPGTGIGLSLVHQFAALHGGTCDVEDRSGGGTRFRVSFPLHHDAADVPG